MHNIIYFKTLFLLIEYCKIWMLNILLFYFYIFKLNPGGFIFIAFLFNFWDFIFFFVFPLSFRIILEILGTALISSLFLAV